MKKRELVQEVYKSIKINKTNEASVTQELVEMVINTTCDVIAADLIQGGETRMPRLGLLYTVNVPERQGRNPQTGEGIVVPAHRSLRFSAGSKMKDALR